MSIFKKKEPKKPEEQQADESNAIEQVNAEDAQIKDDVPTVNQGGRDAGNAKSFKMLAVVLIGFIVILVGIAMTIGRYQQSKAEAKAKETEAQAQAQKNMATGTKSVDIEADKQAMLPPPMDFNDVGDDTEATDATATETPVVEPIPTPVETPKPQPRYNSYNDSDMVAGRDYVAPAPLPAPAPTPIMPVYDDEDEEEPTPTAVAPVVEKIEPSSVLVDVYGAKTATTTAQTQETGLAGSMRSSNLANGTVNKRGDTTMMLLKGTTIPCVLKTKVDSTYQGFTICQVSKDVYSANGKVLLIERGSSVFGEQNIQMSQGKARVSILWSRIETPKNVSINLDSPATGQLGEMGVDARVNNHFWKRFGGAIMLSVIQDALAVGRSHLEKQSENSDTTINNTTATAESMSEEILKNTINIPPTAYINQGTVVNIMVARDVDFNSIYGLQRR
ncbi:type IV secretion system protein VirB10 [Moraxella bovis]|uniref:type IV secretion system protein VirB10 n=1 Tax=Moraxella bovis TaxID=476 RepID=UPI00099362C6|nr:type IV secretion system protein VirB10 [Moraxella bovis]OOR90560.1 hypothetical protein B0182_05020 [Moraxella bovis]